MYDIICGLVVYKNEKQQLLAAIQSFLNTKLKVKLFLVDNSPTNDLKNIITDDRVIYIHNPENPGFGASHNIVIEKSIELNSRYHLILNPDIYFESGTLENIINYMDNNIEIGHLMPKVLYPNGDFQFLCKTNPTIFDLFTRGFMPDLLKQKFKKRIDKFTFKNSNFDEIIYNIPYLSGCFMFFRTSTLRKVGFFDDNFFMYLEDADITRRFLEVSKTVYYPNATVFHHYAGLTHKNLKFKWITIKSSFVYFNKWGWIKNII